MNAGILYGIGVGPGASDLLTIRAVRALAQTSAILAARSATRDESDALNIARPYLAPDARIVHLDFPMTRERTELVRAWQKAAETTIAIVASGENAAFLTLGDPLIYSTFGYLMRVVREFNPDIHIEVIPGITSFQAAAAKAQLCLCEGEESLAVLPGILPEQELAAKLKTADTAVILKVYRNREAIETALAASGRVSGCLFATQVETEREKIRPGLPADPPYMSLVISKRT